MKIKMNLYLIGLLIIFLGIIATILGKTSNFYYPLIYLVVVLAIVAIIIIIKVLVKKTK